MSDKIDKIVRRDTDVDIFGCCTNKTKNIKECR